MMMMWGWMMNMIIYTKRFIDMGERSLEENSIELALAFCDFAVCFCFLQREVA
jgi:hypothetical protein